MEDILRMFNPWWKEEYSVKGVIREGYLQRMRDHFERKQIIFLVGMRRVGKTTLMKHFIHELLEKVSPEKVLYVSLDHPDLRRISILDIEKRFREMHGHSIKDKVFLFLDEVHLHEGFEQELKVIHDLEVSKVYASGSASIFILEKGAYLTGRQHFIEVFPFDLKEYLDLNDVSYNINDPGPLIKHADDHVLFGGLPEYLQWRDADYITDLFESILYKDIMVRNGVKNLNIVMDLALLLSQSVGNPLSYRRMGRILDLSHSTVSDYISFFMEIKLIDLIEKEGKISDRKVSMKKIYLTDNGMARVIAPGLNMGALVENLVFNELRKRYKPRYLFKDGKEIDFVFDEYAVEVKYRDRISKEDLKVLKRARGYKKKVVITKNVNGEIEGIRLIPLYMFLLDGLDV